MRVDVPSENGTITPVSEELARRAVKACHSEPISVYVPPDRRLPAGVPGSGELCRRGLANCETCQAIEHEGQEEF